MIKILSQNLGHEGVLVTMRSYGTVPTERQAVRLGSLDLTPGNGADADKLADLAKLLSDPAIRKMLRD